MSATDEFKSGINNAIFSCIASMFVVFLMSLDWENPLINLSMFLIMSIAFIYWTVKDVKSALMAGICYNVGSFIVFYSMGDILDTIIVTLGILISFAVLISKAKNWLKDS